MLWFYPEMLRRFQRNTAPIAAVLLVLVVTQMLDWPGCADENLHHRMEQAASAAGKSLPLDPDGTHSEAGGFPDCLCHVVFVPDIYVPSLGIPTLVYSEHVEVPESLATTFGDPAEHIPIA